MTQAYLGQLPKPLYTGENAFNQWNEFDAAHKTGQRGTEPPPGIEEGGRWSRNNGDGTSTTMELSGGVHRPVGESVVNQYIRIHQVVDRYDNITSSRIGGAGEAGLYLGVSVTPTNENTKVRLWLDVHGNVECTSGNDAQGTLQIRYFDGTDYVGASDRLVGTLNGATAGERHYFSYSDTRVYTQSALRSDLGIWTFRLYGGAASGGTLNIGTSRWIVEEYEDAS